MACPPILDYTQSPDGRLIDDPIVQKDDAIRDILFNAVTCQGILPGLNRNNGRDPLFFQPAKQPLEF